MDAEAADLPHVPPPSYNRAVKPIVSFIAGFLLGILFCLVALAAYLAREAR